jgi:hypothetical protein
LSVNHELTPLSEEHRSHYSFGKVHIPFEYLLKRVYLLVDE